MTKSELNEAIAIELNCSIRTTSNIVNTILDAMTETLVNCDKVEIRGFGSFTVRSYKSYTARNPKTRKEVTVKAKKLPFFKVGKELKAAVNIGVIE